jgi:hypothetical protein
MPSGRACPAASLRFRLAAPKSTSIASTQILRQYRFALPDLADHLHSAHSEGLFTCPMTGVSNPFGSWATCAG